MPDWELILKDRYHQTGKVIDCKHPANNIGDQRSHALIEISECTWEKSLTSFDRFANSEEKMIVSAGAR